MKLLWQVGLCCLAAAGLATAQRGGGGMRGGAVGGNFGGFRGGFAGRANLSGRVGPIRAAFVGFPSGGTAIPANGVALPFTNVFPFGAGFPATPLGFSNGIGFPNGLAFSSANNGFFFGRGWNTGYWGGIGGIGLPYFGSSYWPGYDYGSEQPPVQGMFYAQQPAVEPLSTERARPVMREYDQSGHEIRAATSSAPSQPAAPTPPAERGGLVIHEYDQSGHEILPAR